MFNIIPVAYGEGKQCDETCISKKETTNLKPKEKTCAVADTQWVTWQNIVSTVSWRRAFHNSYQKVVYMVNNTR